MNRSFSAALSLLVLGCGPDSPPPAQLGLQLAGLNSSLSADIAKLRIITIAEGAAPDTVTVELAQLKTDQRRVALKALPAETPVRIRVEGLNAKGQLAQVGVVGPLELGRGEVYKASVVLTPARRSVPVAVAPEPRFLHSATLLQDGRVLIAGGFDQASASACPNGASPQSVCFTVKARRDAWVFDPSQARFFQIEGGLLAPRGGHSATQLPDGRILIAGGAAAALMVIDGPPAARSLSLFPVDASGSPAVFAHYELFEPDAEQATELRAPARGRFVGSAAQPHEPGPLLAPRFLHGAGANPVAPQQVLLAGGLGNARASQSYEVFDAQRAGGYGSVRDSLTALLWPREAPSAVPLQAGEAGWVWLFSGSQASSDDALAERWSASTEDPVGTTAPGSESAFPGPKGQPHPQYAAPRALCAPMQDAAYALCTASAAPLCTADGKPVYPGVGPFSPCSAAQALQQCFMVAAATGETSACTLEAAHLWGAATSLSDGRALFSGGFSDATLRAGTALELVDLDSTGNRASVKAAPTPLQRARALHTSTGLLDGGVLSVGGVIWKDTKLQLVSAVAELLWL